MPEPAWLKRTSFNPINKTCSYLLPLWASSIFLLYFLFKRVEHNGAELFMLEGVWLQGSGNSLVRDGVLLEVLVNEYSNPFYSCCTYEVFLCSHTCVLFSKQCAVKRGTGSSLYFHIYLPEYNFTCQDLQKKKSRFKECSLCCL